MNSQLIECQLKKYFSNNYKDIYDLIDIDSLIDRTLNYQENYNILKKHFDLLITEWDLKLSDIKTQLEILKNLNTIDGNKEIVNLLNDIKQNNLKIFNILLNHLNIPIADYSFYVIDALSDKHTLTEPQQINRASLNIKIAFKSLNQKLRTFKHNYNNINNVIDISKNRYIDNINKVVNLIKSNKNLKYYKVYNREYRFFFYGDSSIIISYNNLLKSYYIALNTTKFKTLNFFVYKRTFKFWNGIKRQSYVYKDRGHIKYFKAGFIKINYNTDKIKGI